MIKTMRLDFKNQKPLANEELSQRELQSAVEKTKLQLASDILATKSAIADVEEEISVIKTTFPLDTQKYVDKVSELIGLKEGLKQITALQKELGLV